MSEGPGERPVTIHTIDDVVAGVRVEWMLKTPGESKTSKLKFAASE